MSLRLPRDNLPQRESIYSNSFLKWTSRLPVLLLISPSTTKAMILTTKWLHRGKISSITGFHKTGMAILLLRNMEATSAIRRLQMAILTPSYIVLTSTWTSCHLLNRRNTTRFRWKICKTTSRHFIMTSLRSSNCSQKMSLSGYLTTPQAANSLEAMK